MEGLILQVTKEKDSIMDTKRGRIRESMDKVDRGSPRGIQKKVKWTGEVPEGHKQGKSGPK